MNLLLPSELNSSTRRAPRRAPARAFTLLEMLTVLVIIGIIAALALPALRGPSEGVAMKAAVNQMLGDLALARQKAIANRATVAVVFVPPNIDKITSSDSRADTQLRRLEAGMFTQYALLSLREVGEQPGRGQPRYITQWRSLPEKTFVSTNKFFSRVNGIDPFSTNAFPFPFGTNAPAALPYVAFDHTGQCVIFQGGQLIPNDVYIPMSRGAVLYTRDPNNNKAQVWAVQEIPPGNSSNNVIYVDALTGRAKNITPAL